MKDSHCKSQSTPCPYYITPDKAGFSGPDNTPGVMKRHGRCMLSGRIVARMKSCPKKEILAS